MTPAAQPAVPADLEGTTRAGDRPARVEGPRRRHARGRVAVAYRQHWRSAETAVRSAAAATGGTAGGVDPDLAIGAFELLRVCHRDYRSGVLVGRRRRPLSGRALARELGLSRATVDKLAAVLEAATAPDGGPLLARRGRRWVLRTAWMETTPAARWRSWLATDRETFAALAEALAAHARTGEGRGTHLWAHALGSLVTLRYEASWDDGALLARDRGGEPQPRTEAALAARLGVDAGTWARRRDLLTRVGAVGPLMDGSPILTVRHWDALAGLAGVVDKSDYLPPYLVPSEGSERGLAQFCGDDTPSTGLVLPTDPEEERARGGSPGTPEGVPGVPRDPDAAHQTNSDRGADGAASHTDEQPTIDPPDTTTGDDPRHLLQALQRHPHLVKHREAVTGSFPLRQRLRDLSHRGWDTARLVGYALDHNPMPWPDTARTDPDAAVGTLVWRLGQLLTMESPRRANAQRQAEQARDRRGRQAQSAVDERDRARHETDVAAYRRLPHVDRERVCDGMRGALGWLWAGTPAGVDDAAATVRRSGPWLREILEKLKFGTSADTSW